MYPWSFIIWLGEFPTYVFAIVILQLIQISITTLLYLISSVMLLIYTTLPIANDADATPVWWLNPVNMLSLVTWWAGSIFTSLLFFFRALAVFKHSRAKRIIFCFLWVFTGCATCPLLFDVAIPLTTDTCKIVAGVENYMTFKGCPIISSITLIALVLIAFHNILVFVCVSHALLGNNWSTNSRSMRTLLTGNGLYPVSKSLLRSGQLYVRQVADFSAAAATADTSSMLPVYPLASLSPRPLYFGYNFRGSHYLA